MSPVPGHRRSRENAGAGFPPFRPRFPWLGGDLQTLRNAFLNASPRVTVGTRRLEFPMEDGTDDRLNGLLDVPSEPGTRAPLVLLLHGLTGCESSAYMLESARHFVSLGHPVLRLNLRGSVPTRPHCSQTYHAGRSEDLAAVLAQLQRDTLTQGPVLVIAFSLAGSMLLRLLATRPDAGPVLAAVTVSTPIALADTARQFLRYRNRPYHRWLLRHMKADTLALRNLDPGEIRAVERARNVVEFDETFIAPRFGFTGAADYYRRCSARQFLDGITVPVLLIHACDDPWIPARTYREVDWTRLEHVSALLPRSGGHVGFHDAGPGRWHNRVAAIHFRRHLSDREFRGESGTTRQAHRGTVSAARAAER